MFEIAWGLPTMGDKFVNGLEKDSVLVCRELLESIDEFL